LCCGIDQARLFAGIYGNKRLETPTDKRLYGAHRSSALKKVIYVVPIARTSSRAQPRDLLFGQISTTPNVIAQSKAKAEFRRTAPTQKHLHRPSTNRNQNIFTLPISSTCGRNNGIDRTFVTQH
jgi:hypothetical protein